MPQFVSRTPIDKLTMRSCWSLSAAPRALSALPVPLLRRAQELSLTPSFSRVSASRRRNHDPLNKICCSHQYVEQHDLNPQGRRVFSFFLLPRDRHVCAVSLRHGLLPGPQTGTRCGETKQRAAINSVSENSGRHLQRRVSVLTSSAFVVILGKTCCAVFCPNCCPVRRCVALWTVSTLPQLAPESKNYDLILSHASPRPFSVNVRPNYEGAACNYY